MKNITGRKREKYYDGYKINVANKKSCYYLNYKINIWSIVVLQLARSVIYFNVMNQNRLLISKTDIRLTSISIVALILYKLLLTKLR